METVCTKCGQDLPRDDARFCNNCGTLVPSHPFSVQSLAASGKSAPATWQEPLVQPAIREQKAQPPVEKPALREQIAQQPRPRSTRRIAPEDLAASSIAWPAPMTHVSVKELSPHKEDKQRVTPEPVKTPASEPRTPARPAFAERELRVKVWEQANPPTPLPETKNEEEQEAIEDTPTSALTMVQPIEDTPTSAITAMESLKEEDVSHLQTETPSAGSKHRDEMEQLDTVPVPSYAQTKTPSPARAPQVAPENTPQPIEQRGPQNQPIVAQQPVRNQYAPQMLPLQAAMVQTQQPLPPRQQNIQPPQQSYTPPAHPPLERRPHAASVLAPMPTRKKSRVPLFVLLAALFLLVFGGGLWVVLAQPFVIPAVTQPLQDFKDTHLGVALSYPSSWSAKHDATSVLFADSTHTAQVKLTSADAGGDAAQYAQQQATKSGMTAIKPMTPLSFAGASWQQIQGNMQQDGVNYATTMLVTVHGNRTYVLTQMAPQNVYTEEESVVFSPMRNTFKFL